METKGKPLSLHWLFIMEELMPLARLATIVISTVQGVDLESVLFRREKC